MTRCHWRCRGLSTDAEETLHEEGDSMWKGERTGVQLELVRRQAAHILLVGLACEGGQTGSSVSGIRQAVGCR